MMEICLWLGYSSALAHVSFKTQIICLYGTASVEQEQATEHALWSFCLSVILVSDPLKNPSSPCKLDVAMNPMLQLGQQPCM